MAREIPKGPRNLSDELRKLWETHRGSATMLHDGGTAANDFRPMQIGDAEAERLMEMSFAALTVANKSIPDVPEVLIVTVMQCMLGGYGLGERKGYGGGLRYALMQLLPVVAILDQKIKNKLKVKKVQKAMELLMEHLNVRADRYTHPETHEVLPRSDAVSLRIDKARMAERVRRGYPTDFDTLRFAFETSGGTMELTDIRGLVTLLTDQEKLDDLEITAIVERLQAGETIVGQYTGITFRQAKEVEDDVRSRPRPSTAVQHAGASAG